MTRREAWLEDLPEPRAVGRSAYVHPDPDCISTARRRHAFERALGGTVPDGFWERLLARAASFGEADRMA